MMLGLCCERRNLLMTALTRPVRVIQPFVCSHHKIAVTHLCHVMHIAHVTRRYGALLLKITVVDDNTGMPTATPQLLLDDAQSPGI